MWIADARMNTTGMYTLDVQIRLHAFVASDQRLPLRLAWQTHFFVVEVVSRRIGCEHAAAGGRGGVVEEVARLAAIVVVRGARTLRACRRLDVVLFSIKAGHIDTMCTLQYCAQLRSSPPVEITTGLPVSRARLMRTNAAVSEFWHVYTANSASLELSLQVLYHIK